MIDPDELRFLYEARNLRVTEIASKLGVTPQTVARQLEKAGIGIRCRSERREDPRRIERMMSLAAKVTR